MGDSIEQWRVTIGQWIAGRPMKCVPKCPVNKLTDLYVQTNTQQSQQQLCALIIKYSLLSRGSTICFSLPQQNTTEDALQKLSARKYIIN